MPFHAFGSLCSDSLNSMHKNMKAALEGIIHMLFCAALFAARDRQESLLSLSKLEHLLIPSATLSL
jgi:hypothetical protein